METATTTLTFEEAINHILANVEAMVDAKGIDKCNLAITTTNLAKALYATHIRQVADLSEQLAQLREQLPEQDPEDEETETVGGKTYQIG